MSKKNNQCCNIGCSKKGSFTCSGCKTEAYCSRECQIGHWAVHKNTCKSKKGSENVVKNESALNYSSLSVKQLKHIIRSKVNGFGDAERKQIISEMNKLSNQEDLVVLAEKHVEKSEIKSLLSTLPDKSNTPGAMMQMQQSRGGGKAKRVQKEEEIDLSKASPSQLRLQAQYLRKNPNLVRKQQPSMAHMSDAEILEAAEQLEQLANNPASMKEFKENWGSLSAEEREMMKNITPEQREQIRNLTPEQKEQIKNISPAQKKEMMKLAHMSPNDKKNLQIFQEGIQGVIDEKWINAVMELLKNKPEIFKTMFKGMGSVTGGEGADDSQVDPYIDFIVGMGECKFKFGNIFKLLSKLLLSVLCFISRESEVSVEFDYVCSNVQ